MRCGGTSSTSTELCFSWERFRQSWCRETSIAFSGRPINSTLSGSIYRPVIGRVSSIHIMGEKQTNPDPKRILLILHGSVGDVTRALPLANLIHRGFPKATLA